MARAGINVPVSTSLVRGAVRGGGSRTDWTAFLGHAEGPRARAGRTDRFLRDSSAEALSTHVLAANDSCGGWAKLQWVRPDLNRSRQHPKLVGFPVGQATRGPEPKPSYPTDPRATRRNAVVKKLPRRLRSAKREDFVDEFRVGQDHAPAAVTLQPEGVEDLGGVLPLAGSLDERGEGAPDDFATCETADGDDHSFTGTISGASCGLHARGASSAASDGCPGRSTSGRIPGTASRVRCRSGTGPDRGRWRCGRHPPGP